MSEIPDGALYLVSKYPLLTINRETPWLLRGGYNPELGTLLVLLTNLKHSYFSFTSYEELELANRQNNPKMKASVEQIMEIVHYLLTQQKLKMKKSDSDILEGIEPGTGEFQIKNIHRDSIELVATKMIKIYPFVWNFTLDPLDQQQHASVMKDLVVSPMLGMINALDMKCSRLFDSYSQSREYLMTKLTPHELKLFKSQYIDDEREWKFCIRVDERDGLVPRLNTSPALAHFQNQIGLSKAKKLQDNDYQSALMEEARNQRKAKFNAVDVREDMEEEEEDFGLQKEQEEKKFEHVAVARKKVEAKPPPPQPKVKSPSPSPPKVAPAPAKKKKKKVGGFL